MYHDPLKSLPALVINPHFLPVGNLNSSPAICSMILTSSFNPSHNIIIPGSYSQNILCLSGVLVFNERNLPLRLIKVVRQQTLNSPCILALCPPIQPYLLWLSIPHSPPAMFNFSCSLILSSDSHQAFCILLVLQFLGRKYS